MTQIVCIFHLIETAQPPAENLKEKQIREKEGQGTDEAKPRPNRLRKFFEENW